MSDPKAPKEYRDFVPHIEKLSFHHDAFRDLPEAFRGKEGKKARKRACDNISCQLLDYLVDGKVELPSYWGLDRFKGLRPVEIELEILRNLGRSNYGLNSEFGVPGYIHGLRSMKALFPNTDITPSLADITELAFLGYSHGRKFLHLLGSMNSGKSSASARLMWLFLAIDPGYSFGIVAAPEKNSANQTIMGELKSLYKEICNAYPAKGEGAGCFLFPRSKSDSEGRIILEGDGQGKAGWMALKSLHAEGKLIGTKGEGKEKDRGHCVISFDEINRTKGRLGFKADLVNAAAQAFFLMFTSQNPRDEGDEGGLMCEPRKWRGWGWDTFDDVRNAPGGIPVIWPTVDAGIAYRMNGEQSPNIVLGKDIYTYLFSQKNMDFVAHTRGRDTIHYWSQVLGMFAGGEVERRLISLAEIRQSRYDDEGGWGFYGAVKRVMFCDAAFTGRGDDAVIVMAEFGEARVKNIDGTQDEMPILNFFSSMEKVTFRPDVKWDPGEKEGLNGKFTKLGGDFNHVKIGETISFVQQIAIRMAELARDHNIMPYDIGYDYSMRPDMIQAVNLILGADPVPFDYNRKPIGYFLNSTREKTEDKCKSRIDELGYLVVDVLKSRQLRGGLRITEAIEQLRSTRVDVLRAGYPMEKKLEFKSRNQGKSPDERDGLMGANGMAFLRGFRSEKNRSSIGGSNLSIFEQMRGKRNRLTSGFKELPNRREP